MIVQASDTAERKPQEDESSSGETPRSHLLIAGTGRAGTSFLVRYFHALGLDTHLSRHPQSWSELANAGLEDLPFPEDKDLPYVVKTPWLAEFIEQLLRSDFKIDAVLIPVRDLRDAASSRCIVEQGAIYSTSKWMLSMDDTWDEWGLTPGGVIYSLDPVDLERLLAVKFAHLVHALVKAGVNMIFLNFPRITEDGEYLFSKVQDFLPTSIDLAAAVEAHRQVVDKGSVRVSMERKAARDSAATVQAPESPLATSAPERSPPRFDREVARSEVDLVALRREIARSKAELRDVNAVVQRLQETEERLREMQAHSARLEATVSRLRGRTLKGIFQRMFLSR